MSEQCPVCGRFCTENRLQKLYKVNTIAGWAESQLIILRDMIKAEWRDKPDWIVGELDRILKGITTVAKLEKEEAK